jgi:hypothetical protein
LGKVVRTKARALLATAATVGIAAATLAGPTAAQARPTGGPVHGCAYGAVCIYSDASLSRITQTFWSYGPHNLVNQFGFKPIINNQYGGPGATAVLCFQYNGKDCDPNKTIDPVDAGPCVTCYAYFNLTPYNSIVLNRP